MSKSPLVAIVLALIAFPVFADNNGPKTPGAMTGTDTAPGKIVTLFHKSLKSGDAKTARSLLADNVIIFEGGRVERSADEYAHHHMQADMKYLKHMETQILEHQVIISGNSAVSMSRSHTKGAYKDKPREHEGMETMVLGNTNGSWKITHIHWSN